MYLGCNYGRLKLKFNRSSIRCVCLATWFFPICIGFSHGDVQERIVALTAEIDAAPRDARLLLERAELRREHEEWTAALGDYDAASKLDPSLDTGLLRGRVLLESNHADGSLVILNRFLYRHPADPRALTWRARVLMKLGRESEAFSDYREALKQTYLPEPDLVIESADAFAARGCGAEAVRVLEGGIGKLGQIPAFVLKLIDLEIAAKDFNAALGRVEAMRQSAPRPEPWMARRASILAQQCRFRESRAAWQELIEYLAALPPAERGSHSMSTLSEESRQALASLASQPDRPQPLPGP